MTPLEQYRLYQLSDFWEKAEKPTIPSVNILISDTTFHKALMTDWLRFGWIHKTRIELKWGISLTQQGVDAILFYRL